MIMAVLRMPGRAGDNNMKTRRIGVERILRVVAMTSSIKSVWVLRYECAQARNCFPIADLAGDDIEREGFCRIVSATVGDAKTWPDRCAEALAQRIFVEWPI